MDNKLRVRVWSEFRQEQTDDEVKKIYPKGMSGAIADFLNTQNGITAVTAKLDDPEQGLSEDDLEQTDVLLWWGHVAHHEVRDEVVDRVQQRVLAGMGLILLHSAHFSKIFRRMLGTNGSLSYRCIGEKEKLWNCAPGHEITQGVGECLEIPQAEMYGEPFDIPEPDKTVFISWFEGGEVMRSGVTYERGNGRIFYFKPGHETYPIYYMPEVQKIVTNSVRWAAPRVNQPTHSCRHHPWER